MATKDPVIELVIMSRGCEVEVAWWHVRKGWQARAYLSPLTGGWLVARPDASFRVARLKDARRAALGGNGRRYGGHTEVSSVLVIA